MSAITVLMAVCASDSPEFLDRAMKSIWDDQLLKPSQIVLVEDGRLGKELSEVTERWEKRLGKILTMVKFRENHGLTHALNRGIQEARGKYIARMDSDDISLPTRFAAQYKFMEEHPDIDVLGGGLQEIDENDTPGFRRSYPVSQTRIKKYIAKANPIAHSTAFIRASIFKQGFSYDEHYRKNQDLKLWFDLLAADHNLGNLSDVVLKFRRTSDTYEKRKSKISLKSEYEIYTKGISRLYGSMNWRQVYPMVRYMVKSLSPGFNKFVYRHLFKKQNR